MLAVVGGTAIAESGSGKPGSGGSNFGSGSSNSGKKMLTYNFFGTVTAVTPGGTATDPNIG
jgi:hypothetical protein